MGWRRAGGFFLAGVMVVGACAGGACGGSSNNGYTGDGGPGGPPPDGGGPYEHGPILGGDGSPDGTTGSLTVKPPTATVTDVIPGAPATQQFQAYLGSSAVATAANWSIDNAAIGTVDGNGLFTASGLVGGSGTITAQAGSAMGTAAITVKLQITENPGNVPLPTQMQLQGGGSADPMFRWLYPYDKTVFPRGLTPPVLQLDGTNADFVYVHMSSMTLDYKGYFGPSSPQPNQVTLSTSTWQQIVESVGASDPLTVAVTKISSGAVTGPATETWTIAQGSLHGTVYYNSYDSQLGGGNGAVLQMRPGTPASLLFGGSTGCSVCHAVAANGSMGAADGPGDISSSYTSGSSYTLTSNGMTSTATTVHMQGDSQFAFAGFYPDGTLLLTNASLPGGPGNWPPNVPGVGNAGAFASQLMDPRTGANVPAPGFDGVVTNALMPAFSPDGKKVAFNHYDSGQGHSLAMMNFDVSTKTFSGLVDVATDPVNYLGWPAFLPDSAEFVYHSDDGQDFATWSGHHADVDMVDLATKTVTPLNTLNGLSGGQPYLPYGSQELHLNYEPTSLPVAVGGYYWVVFTSRRFYGNTINPSSDPDPWANSRRKKLWVAAIDLNPTPGTDPSHPAFYINDQELAAGNMRGFWVLDPCKMNGNSCNTGDECCTGFCRQGTGGGEGGSGLTCVAPPSGCAQEYEKCTTTADCCGANQGYVCINGYCARPSPK